MPLGPPLNTPFYGGDIISAEAGSISPVALQGHNYVIDTKKYRRQFTDAQKVSQDISATPGESTLNPEGIWVRSGTDWRFGAGQARYDGEDVNRARFQRSFGIDPWTQGQVSLLPDTVLLYNTTQEVVRTVRGPSDQLVVAMANATVAVIVAGVASMVTGLSGSVTSIADATCDDTTVWLATNYGVWRFPFATLVATRFDTAPSGTKPWQSILIANGRIIGGQDADLCTLTAAGAVSTVFSHASAAFRWTVLAEHPQAIYAGGALGSRCEVFRLGVTEATGSLSAPVQALFLPGGEIVHAMVHDVGVVILTTTRGVRLATVDDQGNLTYGRAIETGSTSEAVYAKGDYVWFAWRDLEVTRSGVGRLAPQRFGDTEGRVPAYASDLSAPYSARITAICEHQGKVVFAVQGQGLYIEDPAQLMTMGYLETGLIDMDIPYSFQPVDVQVASLPLAGSIDVIYTLWEGTTDDLGVFNTPGDLESNLLPFPSLSARGLSLRFELNRGSATTGPTMLSWLLRVTPQSQRVEQILLPILLNSEVAFDDDQPSIHQDTLKEYQHLRDLVMEGQIVTYQEGPTAYRVKVENVQLEPTGWTDKFRFFEGTALTQLRVME